MRGLTAAAFRRRPTTYYLLTYVLTHSLTHSLTYLLPYLTDDGGSLQTTGCPLHHDGYQHTLTLPPWSRTRGQGPWEPWSRTWALQLAALTASVLIGCCTATPSTAGPWPHGPSTGLAPSYSSDSGLVNLLSEASGLVNLLSEARPALLHATTAATLLATLWSLW